MPWQLVAERTGAELRFIPVDERGLLVLDDLDRLLDGCKLVAITHVSNSLGTIVPLESIVPRAHAAGAIVLVDGAQGVPHLPVDVKALDVDFYTFSGHKMLGPTGIGVLYGKRALLEAMPPFLAGGDMIRKVEYASTTFNELPWKFEAGTSNIADAIAFGVATDYLSAVGMDWVREHERKLVAYAFDRLGAFESRADLRSTGHATPISSRARSRSTSPTSTRTISLRFWIPKASACGRGITARCRS